MESEIEKLKREEALIKAWIRDVTAQKMARLKDIQRKLKGVLGVTGNKGRNRDFAGTA
jgi:hypothetical protein